MFGNVRGCFKNIPVDGLRQARAELTLLLLRLVELGDSLTIQLASLRPR